MSTETHRWYNRAAWRKRQRHQLMIEQLCRQCGKEGRITAATVVDHCVPHKGDYNSFRTGAVQSLCASRHSSTKAIIEKRGYDTAIGADGMPIDPKHPCYQSLSDG